eukprot:TRINITY_DN28437_c0_g1_i2.p1 TRINITY_DN28437_c0_g1~~TRINITY_DN28437_c0_g1_i2.p1  ORF type:complete len:469 (-),score=79.89 TRINITY_DN28437_c0_g1_i2:53-1459(-)
MPPPQQDRQQPSDTTQLTRQNSLSLLKRRNPNATRRPRPPKMPSEIVEACRCTVCEQLVDQCVDCNYCHAIFCRNHWDDAVYASGKCPACSHRSSSYDCADNMALQRVVDLIRATIRHDEQSPSQSESAPMNQAPRRSSLPKRQQPSESGLHPSGFAALVGDDEVGRTEPVSRKTGGPSRRKPSVFKDPNPNPTPPPSYMEPPSGRRSIPVSHDRHNDHADYPPPQSPPPPRSIPVSHDRHNDHADYPPPQSPPPPREHPALRNSPPGIKLTAAAPPTESLQPELPVGSEDLAMGECAGCRRRFKLTTLEKHEPNCIQKKNAPKRKVFNAKAQILAGTGAEKYVDKNQPITGKSQREKAEDKPIRGKVPKWKQQSDELKRAMRANKEYNQAIKQGKPPPPVQVSSEPDPSLVPCPHCGRTFNENAAERHIPKCATQKAKPTRLVRGSGFAAGNKAAHVRGTGKRTVRL